MNFLFLTTMMILIFTLASTSMTSSIKTTLRSAYIQDNQLVALYAFHNQCERDAYNRSKNPQQTRSDAGRKQARQSKQFIPRKGALSENSKLNLYPILDVNTKIEQKNLLIQTFKNLIEILYGHENFIIERKKQNPLFLDNFVKECIASLKKKRSLAKVDFSNNEDREFYLMLCKGAYKTKNKRNPLLNYITLQDLNNEPPLVFPNLSAPVITAYFGSEIAAKIFKEEEKMYFEGKSVSRLTKEGLEKQLSLITHNVHISMLTYSHYTFNRVQSYSLGSKDILITKGPPVSL